MPEEQVELHDALQRPSRGGPFSYFMRIRKLAWLNRANDQFRFHQQNVAEHSFFVAHLALWICDEENIRRVSKKDLSTINREQVMEKALFHDVPESIVGDLSYRVKKMNLKLEEEFDRTEKAVTEQQLFQGLHENLQKRYIAVINKDWDSEAGKVVKYADMIEVLIYAYCELKAGNRHFQEIWVNGTKAMINRESFPCVAEFIKSMQWEILS